MHCEGSSVHEETWTDGDASPSEAVLEAIAAVEGVDPMDLDPLYDEIDIEAIDRLFDDTTSGSSKIFQFTVHDWNVFVRGDGRVRICDSSEPAPLTSVFESATAD